MTPGSIAFGNFVIRPFELELFAGAFVFFAAFPFELELVAGRFFFCVRFLFELEACTELFELEAVPTLFATDLFVDPLLSSVASLRPLGRFAAGLLLPAASFIVMALP